MDEINYDTFVFALEQAGVDNWQWYDESMGKLSEEERKDSKIVYDTLQAHGVDNWEFYGIAVDLYDEMFWEDSVDDQGDDEEEYPVSADVPLAEPDLDIVDAYLLSMVGKDEFEKIRQDFWKFTTHPKEFEQVRKMLSNGCSLVEARIKYVDMVFGSTRVD